MVAIHTEDLIYNFLVQGHRSYEMLLADPGYVAAMEEKTFIEHINT